MRVGLLIPNFNGGGAERAMISYANGLVKRNIDVFFFVGKNKGPLKELLDPSIEKVTLNKKRILLASFRLSKVLKAKQIDVCISTLKNANLCLLVATKLFRAKAKCVIREASVPSKVNYQGRSLLVVKLAKYLFRYADACIAVSEYVAEDFANFYGLDSSTIFVIYNPAPVIGETKRPQHPFFTETVNSKLIVGIGRIVPVKNFSLLVEAFAEVRKSITSRLIILGQKNLQPAELEKVQQKIQEFGLSDFVDLAGFVDNPEDYVSHSDVLVLSSNFEGFPNVVLLALSCATPIVSTNCSGGLREIIDNGKYGKLTEVGESSEMAVGIIEQLENPMPRKKDLLERAAFFSEEAAIDQLLNLLGSVTQGTITLSTENQRS
ncbi:MAG: glycosyltransferase [Bacteroidota bacterium]